jgi:phage replication O-like protein O
VKQAYTKHTYTKMYTPFIEALIDYDVDKAALKCALLIARKTWGWHKDSDAISLSQFQKATHMSTRSIVNGIAELESLGLLVVKRDPKKVDTNVYSLIIPESGTKSEDD